MPAGSILPVALFNGELFFLFGKEMEAGAGAGFSDFGGHREKFDKSFFDTAVREGAEELSGFLGDEKELRKRFRKKKAGGLKLDNIKNDYHIYFLPIDYDENLPLYYNSNMAFLIKNGVTGRKGLFEKERIKWFSVRELSPEKTKCFREFYRDIVAEIVAMETQIISLIKKSGGGGGNGRKNVTLKKTRGG